MRSAAGHGTEKGGGERGGRAGKGREAGPGRGASPLRSPFFLRPAKTIFVPGMYFLGLSRYSKSVSSPQVMPAEAERVEAREGREIASVCCCSETHTKCVRLATGDGRLATGGRRGAHPC